MTLGDGQRTRIATIIEAVAPRPAGRRALDAEEMAIEFQYCHLFAPPVMCELTLDGPRRQRI